jgi:cation:H+ antiporter
VTIAVFVAGLAITLGGSELLARGLTRLGSKLGFSEGLLGLLAALGADSPELSSAVIAIAAGAGDVGVGVVIGSNLFNLAALLGLSAIVAGGVLIRRGPVILDAAVGIAVMLAAALMVAGVAPPTLVAVVVLLLVAAYAAVLTRPGRRFANVVPIHDAPTVSHGSWLPVLLLPVAIALVVGGSYAMVRAALDAAPWLHISHAVLGTIVLAALTSLPNLWVALHFARANRGTALYSAAMNSNTINLLGGLILPALFAGSGIARGSLPYFGWLLDLTLLAVLAPLPRRRLSPTTGLAIIAIYLAFAGLRLVGI